VKRHAECGKLMARERIELLLDRDSAPIVMETDT